MRWLSMFLTVSALTVSAFWLTVLTDPPRTEAAPQADRTARAPMPRVPIADD